MRFLFVLIAFILAAGCNPSITPTPEPSLQAAQIELEIDPDPAAVGDSALNVTVTRDGTPLAEVLVAARGDMNHAGMQPVLGEATADADGKATVPFQWTMGGDWIVTITVTLPDGSEVSQTFDVSVQT